MRSEYAWFPMPTFEYRDWLIGLIVANAVFLLLTPLRSKCAVGAPVSVFFRWRPFAERYGPHAGNNLRADCFFGSLSTPRTGLLLLAADHRGIHLSPGSIEDSAHGPGEAVYS